MSTKPIKINRKAYRAAYKPLLKALKQIRLYEKELEAGYRLAMAKND